LVAGLKNSSAEDSQCNDKSTDRECYEAGLSQVGTALAQYKSLAQQIQNLSSALNAVVPRGAVIAFSLESGCPAGWVIYKPALSRFIVGASGLNEKDFVTAKGLTPRVATIDGGEEKHTLTIAELPSFSLDVYPHAGVIVGTGGKFPGAGSNDPNPPSRTDGRTSAIGGGQPHNIMPPFVALFYCTRE
jgi:hypothetical protein